MRTGLSADFVQTFTVLFERRRVFAAWLALTMGSAVGGWFFGRSQFLPPSASGPQTRTSKSRRTEPVLAADSPKGQWTQQVKKATPADFPRLLEEWRNLFPETEDGIQGQPEHALRWLFAQWLVHDREGFVKATADPEFYSSYQAAQVIVQIKPELAAELLRGRESKALDKYFTDFLTSELASQRPALYLSLNPDGIVDFTPGDHMANDDWETAIRNLSKTDPEAAANAWRKRKLENNASSLLNALLPALEAWMADDPPLKEWVSQIDDPEIRDLANHARLMVLSKKDPRAALAELYSSRLQPNNDLRTNAPGEVLTQLAKQDLPSALRLLKETEEGFFSRFKTNWQPLPPQEELAENPFGNMGPWGRSSNDSNDDLDIENNGVRDTILGNAADLLPSEPGELIAALHKLRTEMGNIDEEWQRRVEAGLIRVKLSQAPVETCLATAKLWAGEMNGEPDDKTFQSLAARAAKTDPDKAEAALDSLPEAARASFAAEIVKALPPEETERRLALLGQFTPTQWDKELGESLGKHAADYADSIATLPGATTSRAREEFMKEWALNDPEAAAQWFAALPQDAAAGPAALGLFNGWRDFDKSAAITWAESLPAGPARQAVALDVVRALADRSPGEAWRWAATITDPKIRAWAYNTLSVTRKDGPEAFRKEHEAVLRTAGME